MNWGECGSSSDTNTTQHGYLSNFAMHLSSEATNLVAVGEVEAQGGECANSLSLVGWFVTARAGGAVVGGKLPIGRLRVWVVFWLEG